MFFSVLNGKMEGCSPILGYPSLPSANKGFWRIFQEPVLDGGTINLKN